MCSACMAPPAGEMEFRALEPEELHTCQQACVPEAPRRVADLNSTILQALYHRGLVYFEVPILPQDRVSIPPLEVGSAV
jgi:FAM91 N-terminus